MFISIHSLILFYTNLWCFQRQIVNSINSLEKNCTWGWHIFSPSPFTLLCWMIWCICSSRELISHFPKLNYLIKAGNQINPLKIPCFTISIFALLTEGQLAISLIGLIVTLYGVRIFVKTQDLNLFLAY